MELEGCKLANEAVRLHFSENDLVLWSDWKEYSPLLHRVLQKTLLATDTVICQSIILGFLYDFCDRASNERVEKEREEESEKLTEERKGAAARHTTVPSDSDCC
uniref:Uncharacterized protein n=1 Tax=Setaria digitata TaxID=48799 RepID=A0A915PCX3_9BILA